MSNIALRILCAILLISGGCLAVERLAFVLQGGSIRLACPDVGDTQWSRLTWEDSTGRFLGVGGTFSITNASLTDAGVYVCRRRLFRSNRAPQFGTSSIRLVVLNRADAPRVPPLVPPDMTTRRQNTPRRRPVPGAPTNTRRAQVLQDTTTRRQNTPRRRPVPGAPTTTRRAQVLQDTTTRRQSTPSRGPVPGAQTTTRKTDVSHDTTTRWVRPVTARRTSPPPGPRSSTPAPVLVRETECADNQVMCAAMWNGRKAIRGCISANWVCDGENDCGNQWDESSCNVTGPCQASTYACDNSEQVVPIAYRCDGEKDCPNGDDEWNCVSPHYLTPTRMYVETEHNATVRLQCVVSGLPRPVISWGDDDGMLPEGSRTEEQCSLLHTSMTLLVNSTLILRPSPALHLRSFHCRVSERAEGIEPSTFNIFVRQPVPNNP